MTSTIPFIEAAAYPPRRGNAVRPLVDGEPAFRRICEAVEAARHSVWVTVTYLWPEFRMPDGGGAFFDVMDRAAARGVDVALLCWRVDPAMAAFQRNAFGGSQAQREMLAARGSGVRIRWDRAQPGFAQHQKTWLIDAGREGEVAFVGGINQNPHSVVAPGHRGQGHNHDVYVEIAGPSAADVHHNFAQRWNEASERAEPDGLWGAGANANLPFPDRARAPCGAAEVQIQRTIHAGRILDGRAAPGAGPHEVAKGERSILSQYLAAIAAARRTIYLENQFLEEAVIVEALDAALARGVAVVLVMPGAPDADAVAAAARPERQAFLAGRDGLGRHPGFTLAGLEGGGDDGLRKPVYVHAKIMLIDDAWMTIGSANLHGYSLRGNAEINAAIWDPATARALRCDLLAEHLDEDTSGLDDVAAMRRFAEVAAENRRRRDLARHDWQGLAYRLDIAAYARG